MTQSLNQRAFDPVFDFPLPKINVDVQESRMLRVAEIVGVLKFREQMDKAAAELNRQEMRRTPLKGTRKEQDEAGQLWLAEGDYGRDTRGVWHARPFGKVGMGSLANHDVVEHEDRTITVSPSILITSGNENGGIRWHGYLERGVWRSVD